MKSKFFFSVFSVLFLFVLISTFTGFSSKKAGKYYGGSASVSVKYRCPNDGVERARTINVTAICKESSASSVKINLESDIGQLMRSDEVYASAISYNIDECD